MASGRLGGMSGMKLQEYSLPKKIIVYSSIVRAQID